MVAHVDTYDDVVYVPLLLIRFTTFDFITSDAVLDCKKNMFEILRAAYLRVIFMIRHRYVG